MVDFIKNRWVLFVVLIVFVVCKIPHLYYQFFWDESWVYAPGIMLMYFHGPSLLPNAIDVQFSRGHPLLFQASAATWMKIFGTSHFSMHCFALCISLLLIVAVYEVGLKLFNQRVAVICALLLVFNDGFFVNSAFLLPDVMLALFAFLSLFYFITEKYVLTAVFMTLLFYTKESGIVLGVILGLAAFLSLFNKKVPLSVRLYKLMSISVPAILIGIFFVIQKQMLGWYLFPAHIGFIDFDLGHTYYILRICLDDVFNWDYLFLLLLVLSILAAFRQKNIKYAILFLPAFFVHFLPIRINYYELDCTLLLSLFLVSFGMSIFFLGYVKYYKSSPAQNFVIYSAVFFIAFLYFSSINFFEFRYIFPAALMLLFLAAVFFDFLISASYPFVLYPVIALLIFIGVYCFRNAEPERDFGAFSIMDVQQNVVDYCEKNNLYDHVISSGSYQDVIHLRNPYSGYLRGAKTFNKVIFGIFDNKAEYAIFESFERDDKSYEDCKKDASFHLVYRKEIGKKWAEIYKKE